MKKYDAIVIGSGNGGLSAALTLATAGKKILVLEQHNLPGGCATSFVRGRFEFEATLHEFCNVGCPGDWGGVGKILAEEYKLPIEWVQIKDLFRVIGTARSGRRYDVVMPTGEEEFIAAMEKAVPGSEGPVREFFRLVKACIAASDYFDQAGEGGKFSYATFLKEHNEFLKVAELPFNEVLRRIDMPEDAIDILGTYWPYMGESAEEISFIQEATMFYTYVVKHPATLPMTAHNLSVTCVERLRELGADVWMNVKALKVVGGPDGRICGVDTTAGFIPARYVIANMSPHTAYTQLLDSSVKVPERACRLINRQTFSSSFLVVYLGLNKSPEELGLSDYTIFYPGVMDSETNRRETMDIEGNYRGAATVYNIELPGISPPGTTMMSICITYSRELWGDFTRKEYDRMKTEVAMKAIKTFEEAAGVKVSPYIEEMEIATPRTFSRYLGLPMGVVYGYSPVGWDTMVSRLMSAKKDQPVPGFLTVGASGPHGSGYSQTFLDGNYMGKMLLKEMEADHE